MERVLLDLKADAGRDAFLRLARARRRDDRELPARRGRPRSASATTTCAAVNPGIVYCSTSGYGQTGRTSQWAGHDLNYLAVGGYLDCSGRDADGGPPLPGRDGRPTAPAAACRRSIAILAALVRRARDRRGRVPRRVGRRRRASR